MQENVHDSPMAKARAQHLVGFAINLGQGTIHREGETTMSLTFFTSLSSHQCNLSTW